MPRRRLTDSTGCGDLVEWCDSLKEQEVCGHREGRGCKTRKEAEEDKRPGDGEVIGPSTQLYRGRFP